jgi:hypothetical protein
MPCKASCAQDVPVLIARFRALAQARVGPLDDWTDRQFGQVGRGKIRFVLLRWQPLRCLARHVA